MDAHPRLEAALAGRYRLEGELGEGGMAVVYLAEDLKHRRPVAVKVLRPEASGDTGAERFRREIEVAAHLNHPNILGLHDSGEADGLLYFIMPFVEGESLRTRLEREGRLSLAEVVRITDEVGSALAYAHEQGLVHRDIKPENILFQAGHALVCDFGIAQVTRGTQSHLTRTGVTIGTFTYMSPEQLCGDRAVDATTDVYALGCLVHEMLSGAPPFTASTPEAVLARKLTGSVPDLTALRPDVPPTVQAVLDAALAPEAHRRPPSVQALTAALDSAVTAAAVQADARRRHRRRVLLRGAATAGGGVLVAGLWWLGILLGAPSMGRIAVLPFVNERADTSQAYYVQGLFQDLVTELSRANVRVIHPNSVARYAGTDLTPRQIAAELGVDGIVDGRARVESDSVAVRLQLVDGQSEEIVWAGVYVATPRTVIGLYRRATRALADAIGVKLDDETRTRLAEAPEVDPQVNQALLQARFHWQKLTAEGLATALNYYELALQLDSLSLQAWTGIARVWTGRVQMGLIPASEGRSQAENARARATAIDSSYVQAEWPSRLVWMEWNWQGGKDAFERALKEDPSDSEMRAYYAHFLLLLDRDREALEQAEEAVHLDPFNFLVLELYAMTLNFLGRYAEAEAVLLPVLKRDEDVPMALSTLRTTYHLMGRHEDAMRIWRESYRVAGDPEALDALERGYAAGGYSAALEAVAELFAGRASGRYVPAWQIGTLYTRAGRADKALEYLEQAFEAHDSNVPYLSIDPIFDPMRKEPRFQALVDRLGLPG